MQFTRHFSHKAIEVGKDIEIHVFQYWWSTYGNSSLNIIYKNEYWIWVKASLGGTTKNVTP
jgi:hypothetical protein